MTNTKTVDESNNATSQMDELVDLDEVAVNRFDLANALEQLDAVRLVLYRELERVDTSVMDRGTGSMSEWCQRNRNENAYGGWQERDQNLLTAFEQTWGLSEFLAEKSGKRVLPLDELKEQDSWLLVKAVKGS